MRTLRNLRIRFRSYGFQRDCSDFFRCVCLWNSYIFRGSQDGIKSTYYTHCIILSHCYRCVHKRS